MTNYKKQMANLRKPSRNDQISERMYNMEKQLEYFRGCLYIIMENTEFPEKEIEAGVIWHDSPKKKVFIDTDEKIWQQTKK